MSDCLIITAAAQAFAEELHNHGAGDIAVTPCATAEAALDQYAGEKILFGNPDLIAAVLEQLPAVEWVQSTWAGVTPLIRSSRREYILTGVKDVFGPQMSEYVFGYLLAHELKVLERNAAQRRKEWFREHSGVLAGRRIGIMGTGSIGAHIAKTARCFGMSVRGLSRTGADAANFDEVFAIDALDRFLAGLDHVVSTLPQTPATDRLLDAESLSKLPAHAYLVNVGRSNVIDDAALADALSNGRLAGAALDVFDEEPLPETSPLWDVPGLSITAHIAAISHPSLIVPIFVDNYRRYVRGDALKYVIDFDAGY